jgi:branched-chain amino acid transport system substrate-binding protein
LRRKRILRVVAVLAVLGLVTAACSKKTAGGGGGAAKTKNVQIAFFGALSGDYKLLVIHGYQAAQLAFSQFNASQKKVNVTLVPEDTQGSPDQAPALVDKVVNDSSFVGIIGPAFSGESAAVGDRFDQAGIPFVTPSATDDALSSHGWTHWFRAVGNNSSEALPAAQYIEQVLKPNCIFIASDGSAYGKGLADIVFKTLSDDGASVKPQQSVEPGKDDYSGLVTKLTASKCSGFFYGGYSPEAGKIRKQATDAGLGDVTMLGGDGIKDDTFLSAAASAGEGTISVCPCADLISSTDPAAQKFVSDYKSKFGEDPGIYGGEGYDIAQLYIAAFEAGKTDRQAITDFVRGSQGFQGLTKAYTWQSNGELATEAVLDFFYEDKGGAWSLVGSTKDVLTGG